MIETPADHGEDLYTRINRVRVMVRLLTTNEAFADLGNNDLAYALDAIESQLEDACNCSGALTDVLTHSHIRQ